MRKGLLACRNAHSLLRIAPAMGLLSCLFGCSEGQKPSVSTEGQYEQTDAYRGLRDQVLGLSPRDLRLAENVSGPIAILMETGYPEAVATLVCVADGTASLYFSNGGGVIGGGEHENVRSTALAFLGLAGEFSNDMKPAKTFPLPLPDAVRFYLVTSNGIRTAEAKEDDLGNMRHPLCRLFHLGHEVIAGIREHSGS